MLGEFIVQFILNNIVIFLVIIFGALGIVKLTQFWWGD